MQVLREARALVYFVVGACPSPGAVVQRLVAEEVRGLVNSIRTTKLESMSMPTHNEW